MPRNPAPTTLLALLFALLLVPPAAADWLVTLDGELIETDGPWTVDDDTVTYTDTEGEERILFLSEIDLEGSEETTAQRAGRAYMPEKKAAEPVEPVAEEASGDDEPKITLYVTSWCGYCRKATKLLKELDADFVTKDIEKNPEAAREFAEKSGGSRGIPLIDFDGEIVRGYSDRKIRRMVREIQQKDGDA